MESNTTIQQQLSSAQHLQKLQPRDRLESVVSTNFSIVSSTTPLMKKQGQTLLKESTAFTGRLPEHFDLEMASAADHDKMAMKVPNFALNLSINERTLTKHSEQTKLKEGQMVDVSTQVYARSKIQLRKPTRHLSVMTMQCAFEGCHEVADGGICDFRVCLSKGCERALCHEHTVQPDPQLEDDSFKHNVCVECEKRASRAFWLTSLLAFGIPLLVAIYFILVNGADTHASSVTAQ